MFFELKSWSHSYAFKHQEVRVAFDNFIVNQGQLICPNPMLIAAPVSISANGTSTSTITLTGAPTGHRVRLISSRGNVDTFSPATGTTDASGQFVTAVCSSTPGTAIITAQDLTTGQTFATSTSVTFTPVDGEPAPPPPNEGPISIAGIDAQAPLDGRFLEGVHLSNCVDVAVNWRGTDPGTVDFILNGETHTVRASDGGANYTFDMGADLQPGGNSLRIVVHNASGQSAPPRDFNPYLLEKPIWMASLQSAGALAEFVLDGPVSVGHKYKSTFEFPENPISLGAPGFGPPGSKAELQFFFGGSARLGLECDAPIVFTGEAGAKPHLDLMGIEFGGELKGSGEVTGGAMECRIPTAQGTLRLDIMVYGQKNWPVTTFIVDFIAPGAGTSLEQTLRSVGLYKLWTILGELYLQGSLSGFLETSVRLQAAEPHLVWQGIGFGGGPGIETGYQLKQLGGEFKVFFGANGELAFVNPNPMSDLTDIHFDQVTVTGEGGWELKPPLIPCKYGQTYQLEWTYPPAHFEATLVVNELTCSLSIFGRGYRGAHAVFRGTPNTRQAFAPPGAGLRTQGVAAQTAVTSVLVSNVYTYPEPSLAVNPTTDEALLTWVHDDASKPVGQSHEIQFSRWDGSSWSTPASVTDDYLLDGAPEVAWTGGGDGVAVWERLTQTLSITATWNVTTARKIEIATSVYSPTADTWSSVTPLTTNDALDFKPQLARSDTGDLLAVWRQNPAGLLSGTITDTDRIMATFYDDIWSTPAVAVDDIPGLMDLAAGYGSGEATLAYTCFLTPTGSVTPTLQLLTSTWDGGTWSSPQQLTDDDLGHTNPQVVYNDLNQPLLVWQAGDTLRLRNLTTSAEASLALDPDLMVDEFRLLHDTANNLAAVFTGQQAGQRDLFVAFYDAAHNAWGQPYRLTNDVHSEGYPAPALDSTGRLAMAYALTQISSEEHTITDPETGKVITYTLPVEGQTDLYTLSHQFVQDLAMGTVAVSDAHPQAGASVTISATVTNTGALALEGVQVAFYDGDPDTGGTLINTISLTGTLAAGYTATLTTTYTIPTTGGQRQLVAVADPQDQIAEADETNNRASLLAFGPDLELAGAGVDYWSGSSVGLSALIRNIGTTASPITTIAYHWDAITGTLAVTDTVPMLVAGDAITLTTPWDYGALAEGSYPLVAVVNEGEQDFAETFTDNNEALLTLEVLPDLAVSPLYLWTEPLSDGQVVITGTVYNFGSVAAPPAEVALYVDDPFTDTARISVTTLPELDAAGYAVVTTTWTAPTFGQHVFYIAVNSGRIVTETTWTNNLASTYGASACTALEVDFDCSCTVDVADIMEVASRWRCQNGEDCYDERYDLDKDGDIDIVDIMLVVVHWGETCE